MAIDVDKIYQTETPAHHPFRIGKLGHVVLMVEDLERSVEFYTQVLGCKVSDAYGEEMVPGGMVFLRFNTDHHGVALVGDAKGASKNAEMHHMAFEVPSLEDVFRARAHLKAHGVPIDFEGRRRADCQVAVEFSDPDGHRLEIYWGLDQIGSDGVMRPREQWKWAHSLEEAIDDPVEGQYTKLRDANLRNDGLGASGQRK